MPLFGVPTRSVGKDHDKKVLTKSKNKRQEQITVKKGSSTLQIINTIKEVVEKNLGHLKDDYLIIRTRDELHNYFVLCKSNGVISIDTETEGLDPIMDKIAGLCIYTPNTKAAYVPINHKSYITKNRVENQLSEQDCLEEFKFLLNDETEIDDVNKHNLEIIMFNATFDIRVIRNQIGCKDIYCTWDCSLASRLLNENEPQKNLKFLHNKYCLNGKGDAFRFDDLFKGVVFTEVPITTAYIYAAHDAIITYEYYMYQKPFLTQGDPVCESRGLHDVADVFHNIEMKVVPVVCDMEDIGVDFDMTYNQELSVKYGNILKEKEKELLDMFAKYDELVTEWSYSADANTLIGKKTKKEQLDTPINFKSPQQLAIFFYDILGCEPVDRQSPRGTGEDILTKLNEKYDIPLCKAILDYRGLDKLIGTYIDKLPNCVCPKDGRIHCKYNQYGADTGRFSSKDPNLNLWACA